MCRSNQCINLDLIMLSKFGKSDGGRETWFYNFFPMLVESGGIKSNVFGFRINSEENNEGVMLDHFISKDKIKPHLLVSSQVKYPRFFRMFFLLRKLLKKEELQKPDVTVSMGIFELVIMLYILHFKHSKKVVWLRGIFLHEKANRIPNFLIPLLQKFELYLLKRADVVLTNGDDLTKHYRDLGIQSIVIKNGVNTTKWKCKQRKIGKKILIAYVGRLKKEKGVEFFFKLIDYVSRSDYVDNFEFHIIGDSTSYSNDVVKYKKRSNVIDHGEISNDYLPQLLCKFDVFVALTLSLASQGGGGTSNALLEQMAAQKVILAWDNLIYRQLLTEKSGYFAAQGSVLGLYEKLLEILYDSQQAESKAQEAYQIALSHSIEAQVDSFKKGVLQ